jgi:uncharacterized protein
VTVQHEKNYQQFTIKFNDEDAELAYSKPSDGIIDFTHTYVPQSARGQGVAQLLVKEGLQYADENKLRVIASCPMVSTFIEKNTEYHRLLK